MKNKEPKKEDQKEESVKFFKMRNEKTGVIADVHPKERLNYFKAGYMPIPPETI